MSKVMIVTSAFLFWAFYEMSGGADFEPPERAVDVAEATPEPAPAPAEPLITIVDVAAPEPTPEPQIENAVFVTEVVIEPAPAAVIVETPVAEPEQIAQDIRQVAGEWVNMRNGPGTGFGVVETLPRGTPAEIISVNADGWAQIRLLEGDTIGWMAERLLTNG